MTPEELQAALDAANQAAEAAQASIAALEAKNSELIDRERAAKTRADKAEKAKLPELDQAKLDREAAVAERDQAMTQLRDFRADAALSRMIANANIDSSHVPVLTGYLKGKLQFSDDGQPTIDGKTVDDFGKNYFGQKGDGYHYVRAANNSGGVVRGSDGTKAPAMNKDNWNNSEFARLCITDPAGAKAMALAAGKPQLAQGL